MKSGVSAGASAMTNGKVFRLMVGMNALLDIG